MPLPKEITKYHGIFPWYFFLNILNGGLRMPMDIAATFYENVNKNGTSGVCTHLFHFFLLFFEEQEVSL